MLRTHDNAPGPIPGLTGAILAGGRARRMGGINKALILLGGMTIFDRILETLQSACEHLLVIANEAEPFENRGVVVRPDVLPGRGSLGGLYTALRSAPTDRVFVCACDMPFVSARLMRHLVSQMGSFDAVVPRDATKLQPMHAVYSRRAALPVLEARLGAGLLKVEEFVDAIAARIVPPEEVSAVEPSGISFLNVNAPADLERAERHWSQLDDGTRRGRSEP